MKEILELTRDEIVFLEWCLAVIKANPPTSAEHYINAYMPNLSAKVKKAMLGD